MTSPHPSPRPSSTSILDSNDLSLRICGCDEALSLFGELVTQPVQALVEAVSLRGAGALDVPVTSPQRVETELVGELGGGHGIGQILLVGKHQQHRVPQLVLLEHVGELAFRLADALAVVAVHHVDQALGILEVMPPERPDLVLAAHVPHGEADIPVLDRLDVEADRGDGGDDLAELELVEDGGLAGGVQTHHQYPHLLLAEQPCEQAADCETHLTGGAE